jgi:site-specific DNA-methyltransferase (cytosine-N4-specific)
MSVFFETDQITLHHGDALKVAQTLESGSVQTIVTSPPYFGLRDYGEDGQIGAEGSLAEYVDRMVQLFRELRRVLADDGTLWLNLGDSYAGTGYGNHDINGERWKAEAGLDRRKSRQQDLKRALAAEGIRPKNLLGVPWRVAFALQDDGWILRSDIIWAKPNPMPESVTDRPTKAHEYLFLFAKSPRYYYDADAIKEEAVKGDAGSSWTEGKTGEHQLGRAQRRPSAKQGDFVGKGPIAGTGQAAFRAVVEERNKRTVWTVPTVPFPGSHFAVYPPELIRPCILAGSRPGDTVLDPFSGSGTTGAVATFEGRKYVGIDLNRDYLELSLRTRFQQPALPWDQGVA